MSRIGNSLRQKVEEQLPRSRGTGGAKWGVTTNRYDISFWGDDVLN